MRMVIISSTFNNIFSLKRLKTEGRSQLYLDHMAVIFFSNIVDTMKEYQRSFSGKTATVSGELYITINTLSVLNTKSGISFNELIYVHLGLVSWVNTETGHFLNSFCRQLFGTQAHLSAVSQSVEKLRNESQQVCSFLVLIT